MSAAAPRLPRWVEPQLATLVREVPEGDGWIHEIKYDGYRMLGRVEAGGATLLSRRAKDWSEDFTGVTRALTMLRSRSALVDGEVAAFLPDGRTSFQSLQNHLGKSPLPIGFVAFDLLFLDGVDLRPLPVEERKERLRELVATSPAAAPVVRFGDYLVGRGAEVWAAVCSQGVEGVMSKRRGRPYRSGRSDDWRKTKCVQRGEFVIGGFTEPEGGGLSGFLVGEFDGNRLVFVGRVGASMTAGEADAVRGYLEQRRVVASPFNPKPAAALVGARARWVVPELVVDVEFLERTDDGGLRHPVLKGIRALAQRTETPQRSTR
jgi:bifunctional non-homologous end joining protein LigD